VVTEVDSLINNGIGAAKMQIPERPPAFKPPDDFQSFFAAGSRPDVMAFIRNANDQYLHWDKFRYKRMPDGVPVQQAWFHVVLSRFGQFRQLPLQVDNSALKFWIPGQHQEWLHVLDQLGGGKMTLFARHGISEGDGSYLRNALMEEAIASSLLEGAVTTREVAKKMLRENRKPRDEAERMVLNNYNAIVMIRELKNERLTPEMLLEIHKVIAHGTLKNDEALGRFRLTEENIRVEDDRTNQPIFTPPPADSIAGRVNQLCDFANEKTKPFIHPIVKAIALHFMVGYIHPFVDGNGRTARALFYWYMLKRGYWAFEYLPISRIFLRAPIKYARAYLYTETDGADLTYFIHYNLRVMVRAVRELHEYLEGQEQDLSQAAAWLESYPGLNSRQLLVVVSALKHKSRAYSIKQHQATHRVGYATARADMLGLEERGLFEKKQIGHKLIFSPHDNLKQLLKLGALGSAGPKTGKQPRNPIRTAQSKLFKNGS
jgi:Fic family protein